MTTKKQVDDARRSAKNAYEEAQAAAEKAQGRLDEAREAARALSDLEAAYARENED